MIKALIAILLFYSTVACATSTEKTLSNHTDKIDPSLLIEIKKLESAQQIDIEVEVLIRTKKEISAVETGKMEKEGVKIGSIIGDILTARIPVKAIPKIADLDFVVYIEKAKKQQLR